MPFTVKNWQDSPSTATPISAAALKDLETRVADYGIAQGRGLRLAAIGDSITFMSHPVVADGGAGQPDVRYWQAEGYLSWALQNLRQRFNVVAYAGVTGNTTTQILARLDAEVLAYSPDVTIVQGGINDIQGAASDAPSQLAAYTTALANFQTLCERVIASGSHVLLLPTLTSGSGGSQLGSGVRRQTLLQLQRAICRYGRATEGVTLIEWHPPYSDPATGYSATGVTSDGTHPSMLGACRLGLSLSNAISGLFPTLDLLPTSNVDSDNKAVNACMTGTGGTQASGGTGAIPAGMFFEADAAGTIATSKVPRTDGNPGEWLQFVITTGDYKLRLVDNTTAVLGLAAGDTVELSCEFETDAAGWTGADGSALAPGIGLIMQALNGFTPIGDTVSITRAIWLIGLSGTARYLRPPMGIMRTPPFTLPPTTTRLMAWLQIQGGAGSRTGTIRAGRNSLYKVGV